MAKLNASEVAALLVEFGRRSALRGGNTYGYKAYLRAAEHLSALAEPLEGVVNEGRLRDIPGVGSAISDIITTLHNTGTHPSLEKLRDAVPDSVLHALDSRTAFRKSADDL